MKITSINNFVRALQSELQQLIWHSLATNHTHLTGTLTFDTCVQVAHPTREWTAEKSWIYFSRDTGCPNQHTWTTPCKLITAAFVERRGKESNHIQCLLPFGTGVTVRTPSYYPPPPTPLIAQISIFSHFLIQKHEIVCQFKLYADRLNRFCYPRFVLTRI